MKDYTILSTSLSVFLLITFFSFDGFAKELTANHFFIQKSVTGAAPAKSVISNRELIVDVVEGQKKTYGEEDPELEYTVTGFESGDDESILTGSLSREEGEDAGKYEITLGDLSAGEGYNLTFKGAIFTIEPKELQIVAEEGQSKVYGQDDPELNYTADGFINGDSYAVITGAPDREEGEDAGNYAITKGNLDAGDNYTIVFSGEEFEITPKSLAVTRFKADSRIYDGTTHVTGVGFEDDRFPGDDLIFDFQATFEDSDAGENKTVHYVGIMITGGADMNNYQLQITEGETTADIERRPITITAEPAVKVYGDSDPYLSWSITDGSMAPGDILAGDLSRADGDDTGQYFIEKGTLTAGTNYDLTFISGVFKIIPRNLSVTVVDNQSKVYGEDDPVLAYNATGFAAGDDRGILGGELTREEGEDAGEYEILQGTLHGGRNYTILFEEKMFEITPRELLVVSEEGQSKIYGENDPKLNYTAEGFVRGDDFELFRGSLKRKQGEDTGKYSINRGDLTAGQNYSIHFQGADFEIIPRLLRVSANAGQSKAYGDEDPELTFTATNFGRNDDENIFKGSLSRMEGETAGFYEINKGNLDAGKNYRIDFSEARFEITYRTLEVTVDSDQSKIYGKKDPVFSYTVEGFASKDDKSIMKGELTRPEGETAGEYPITRGTLAASGDYNIEFNSALFEIHPKILTVKADKGQFKYVGDKDPIFTYKADGFVYDDGLEQLSGSLSREPGERRGEYRILQGSLDAGINYAINYSENTFAILMAPPVATELTPADGGMNAHVNTPVIVKLDQSVSEGDLDLVTITDEEGRSLPVEASVRGNRLQIENNEFEHETNYEVRIPAGSLKNSDGVANEDISWNFRTRILVPPRQVVLSLPQHDQRSVSLHPKLSWNRSEYASEYRIQVSKNPEFNQLVLDTRDIEILDVTPETELENYTDYYWRIQASNRAGISSWSDIRSFTTVAQSPEPLFPVRGAEDVSTAPLLEWSSPYEGKRSRLQVSLSESFDETEIDTVLRDDSFQLTGLEDYQSYYWRVRVEDHKSNSEWIDTEHFRTRRGPAELEGEIVLESSIDFGGSSEEQDISGMDYRLIGLPGSNQHRVDDLLSGTYGMDWKAFLGGGKDSEQFEEYKPDDDRFVFKPGRGFWILSKKALDVELRVTSVETNERDAYAIDLQPGWNIISNPHRNVVSWNDVKELNQVNGDLFGYKERFVSVDSLHPVHGYYFYNDVDDPLPGLEIPYSSIQQRKGTNENMNSTHSNATVEPDQDRAIIVADFGGEDIFEVELIYSVAEGKRDTYLRHYPALELSRKGMMLTDDTAEKGGGFLRSVSDFDERGTKHQIQLKGQPGASFTWKAELNGLGSSARILLVNPDTQRSWLLENNGMAEVSLNEPHVVYDMYVGDQHYLLEKQETMMPMEITLKQNYPNPFNPTTIIRYSLPEQQPVRLEVFDVTGRRVKVIQNGIQQAGWHNIQFNGSSLASGIYFYRLSTDGVIKTGKMTLIK